MKNLLVHTSMFVTPESSGAGSPNKYLGIMTDIGIFSMYTRKQLGQYIWQCLYDFGMQVDLRGPYILSIEEYGRLTDPYIVHIVDPKNGNSLVEIYGNMKMSVATVASMLSQQFLRHEVRVSENGNTIITFPPKSQT